MKSVPSAAHPADIPTSECGVEYQKLYRFGQQPQERMKESKEDLQKRVLTYDQNRSSSLSILIPPTRQTDARSALLA